MTNEAKLRHILVASALKYLNWSEINGQDDLIIDKYNAIRTPRYKMNHQDSWCAAFVSVVKHEAGFDALIPTECGCEEMIRLFQEMGRWQEDGNYIPQIGDIPFYNWDDFTQPNDGWTDHVGIVVSVEKGIVKAIEGNASDKVKFREFPVGWGCIRGYGLPDFASISKEVTEAKEYDGPSIVSYLGSIGKDSSYAARERMAIEQGINGYKGTADQNLLLLKLLRVAPVQQVPEPKPIPAQNPMPTPQQYQVGVIYTVIVNELRVRAGAGTGYMVKSKKDLTADGQKHADKNGRLMVGTKVQCQEIKNINDDIWMRIPSGWIAAEFQKSKYVK